MNPQRTESKNPESPPTQGRWSTVLAVTSVLGLVIACATTLRLSVGLTSDSAVASRIDPEFEQNPKPPTRSDRQLEYERIREKARRDDRWLLQQRQDRIWREQNRDQPPPFAAYEKWLAEVTEIEQLVAEVERVQSELSPE